jgi:hypothetical protein
VSCSVQTTQQLDFLIETWSNDCQWPLNSDMTRCSSCCASADAI